MNIQICVNKFHVSTGRKRNLYKKSTETGCPFDPVGLPYYPKPHLLLRPVTPTPFVTRSTCCMQHWHTSTSSDFCRLCTMFLADTKKYKSVLKHSRQKDMWDIRSTKIMFFLMISSKRLGFYFGLFCVFYIVAQKNILHHL